jgi:hypothetical protein
VSRPDGAGGASVGRPAGRPRPPRRDRPLPLCRRDSRTGGDRQHRGLQRPSCLGQRVAGGDEIIDDHEGSIRLEPYLPI